MTSFKKQCSLALLSACSATAWAGGSSRPKEQPILPLPLPEGRMLKKVAELNTVKSAQVINNQEVGYNFESLINQQFAEIVLNSGRFTIKAKRADDAGTIMMQNGSMVFVPLLDQPIAVSNQTEEDCYMNLAHVRLSGEVIGFELEQNSGFTIGFNPAKGLSGLGASFSLVAKKASMKLGLTATDVFDRRVLGQATTSERQSTTTINARVGYQDLGLGYEHFKRTPLSRVSGRALQATVNTISAQTDPLKWDGRVIVADGEYVGINAGQDAGLKVGDRFVVTNMTHYWRGEACNSAYLGGRADASQGAIVEVYDVDMTTAWARVVQRLSESPLRAGARVSIFSLAN